LGRISGIAEGGGGDLAELTLSSGVRRFAPFRKEFFGDPDFEKRTIVLFEPWVLE
jgi:ribosomal 30S subunit maturation factor RimM